MQKWSCLQGRSKFLCVLVPSWVRRQKLRDRYVPGTRPVVVLPYLKSHRVKMGIEFYPTRELFQTHFALL